MRSSKLWVFLAVTVTSIVAGVAVAGIPSRNSVDLSDVTAVPTSVGVATTIEPISSSAPTTSGPTTASTTEPAAPSSSTSSTTSTSAPVATSIKSTPTTRPPVDREILTIVVANGAATAGVAGETAAALADIGYPNVRTLDGVVTVETSAIFAAPGFEAEGEQLAIDVGIDPELVFPLSTAPEVTGLLDEPLLIYLGTDVVNR